jgi:hypothetical protein
MRKPLPMPNGTDNLLKQKLHQPQTKESYRRVLCLWFRSIKKFQPDEIDTILGLDNSIVNSVQNAYTKKVEPKDVEGILKMYSEKVRKKHKKALSEFSPKDIAEMLGLHVDTVRHIQSEFIKTMDTGTESLLEVGSHGGDRRRCLSHKEERRFLKPHLDLVKEKRKVEVKEIKKSFEALVGREVALSTIYRLLNRHKWFKFTERSSGGIWMFQDQKGSNDDGQKGK